MADVTLTIRAKNMIGRATAAAKKSLSSLKDSAAKIGEGIKAGFMKARGAVVALGVAAAALGVTLKKAFEFEAATLRFSILFKSMDEAKRRVKELQDFSASTPFQFGDIAEASRMLETFSGGALGGAGSLRVFGDAAAGTGQNIKDVSFWVGRAFSSIKAGRPFGEAAMRLQEMGILTGEARTQMEELSKAGATNQDVWNVLMGELGRFEGGMKTLSESGDGLISTLKDNWTLALAEFGKQFMAVAKDDIAALIEWLKRLREDGSITKWSTNAITAIKAVASTIKKTTTTVKEFSDFLGFLAFGKGGRQVRLDRELREGLAFIDKKAAEEETVEATSQVKQEESFEKKVQKSLAASQKKIDEKRHQERLKKIDELKKKEERAVMAVAQERRRAAVKEIAGRIQEIQARAAQLQEIAGADIKDILAGKAAERNKAELDARDKKRAQLIEQELARGIDVSKRKKEFLAAFEQRENAKKELEADRAMQKKLEKERKVIQGQILKNNQKAAENLDQIRKKLDALLVMK